METSELELLQAYRRNYLRFLKNASNEEEKKYFRNQIDRVDERIRKEKGEA